MQKKRMTVGSFARDSEIPQFSDGRCVLSVPVISRGTEQDIALAEELRKKYLNQLADEVYRICIELSVSQLRKVYEQFSAANLGELVYGFLTASEQHLLTLNAAKDIIDEVVRCKDYHIRLKAEDLLQTGES
ncbi:MAG: hypothetical protein IKG82_00775 [Oscillospiraceae bacterium]|nr:hypothetical protein [Oscillospiraceae bacterium]